MGNPPRFLAGILAYASRDRLLHFEELCIYLSVHGSGR